MAVHFGFVFVENLDREIIFSIKLRFQIIFCPYEIEKLVFSNSSGWKSVFEKLCFRGRLVWTVLWNNESCVFKFPQRSCQCFSCDVNAFSLIMRRENFVSIHNPSCSHLTRFQFTTAVNFTKHFGGN